MATESPDWLRRLPGAALPFVRYGWTTAAGPDFGHAVVSDAQSGAVGRLVEAVGLGSGAWVEQVHGGRVVRAETPGCLGRADAMWTTESGLGVVGRSADCPLILVGGVDSRGQAICGFAHASWRSTVAQITAALLRDLTRAGLRPDRAAAVICPSAGPCCYEVGPEVQTAAIEALGPAAATCFPALGRKSAFDLWQANAAQLELAGLAASRIHRAGICTICGGNQYHSYRRRGPSAGRFAAVVGVPVTAIRRAR